MFDQFKGFYRKGFEERWKVLSEYCGLSDDELKILQGGGLSLGQADAMRENVVGLYNLPLSVVPYFVIDGVERLIPVVGEEPSVVAAASKAAKMAMEFGGFKTKVSEPLMTGEILIKNPSKDPSVVEENKDHLLGAIDDIIPRMKERGGGARDVWAREYESERGRFVVVYFDVDVRDAMGANTINTVAESLAPLLEDLLGGKARIRILTNLSIHRMAEAEAVFTDSPEIIEGVLDAYDFAANDPYRAVTNNKGIMNGITALALATGNDTRAVEASAHGFASMDGYKPLAHYEERNGRLVGRIKLPLSLGIVGSGTNHPVARICLDKILRVKSARELNGIAASLGLAQNFAALRALSQEGIQKGHMRLHAKVLALMCGATPEEAARVYELFKGKEDQISMTSVKKALEGLRNAG